jgi:hypothetical protein
MQIIITTQYRENYGAHDWDGDLTKGECPQYWKNKGGNEYVVTDVDPNANMEEVVKTAIEKLECCYSNNYSEEYLLNWEVTEDGELTYEEKQQMDWDGSIKYPSKRIKA